MWELEQLMITYPNPNFRAGRALKSNSTKMEAGKRKILEALEIAVVIVSFEPITSQSCRKKLQFEAFVTEPWSLPLICCEDGAVVAWE